MSYGKADFLLWDDDIDLDLVLGEYTCSEIELSEDESMTSKKQKTITKGSSKKYRCSECENEYSSISGLRGHLRQKHGINNVKASQYRQGRSAEAKSVEQPFGVDEHSFKTIFTDTLETSLTNIIENRFRQIKTSIHGKGIITISKSLLADAEKTSQMNSVLQPLYLSVFNSAATKDTNTNEALFGKFQELISNHQLTEEMLNIIDPNSEVTLPVRQFIGVLLHQLLRDLVKQRASLYSKLSEKNETSLTVNDQTVLYYISGFIISSLNKPKSKSSNAKQEAVSNAMDRLLRNDTDSEKTFVSKYSQWTDKISRGGLKTPSDSFFMFIRECEMCLRKTVDEKNLHTNTYNITTLKEQIMENHMVKYYSEKIVSGECSSYVIEKSVTLFLTVRGNSCARKMKMDTLNCESKKSIRKVLKDKTNVD